MNKILVNSDIYAQDHRMWAYGHSADIRIMKSYDSEKFNIVTQNAAGHFHCVLGIYNMVADYCVRETTLYLRDKGVLKHKAKHLAGIAREDIDRWKKQMRSTTLVYSFDALEAAITDHMGEVMKDIEMVKMQIDQYLTMHGCKDVETCARVALTYLMIGNVHKSHDALIRAFRDDIGIDYGNTFQHCLIDRAEKAWTELALMIVGNQAKGIDDYQPLDTAMSIVVRKLSDLEHFTLHINETVEEYPEYYSEEQRKEIHEDAEKVLQRMQEREKRIRQENAAAKRKHDRQKAERQSTDITDEDLQKLKEKFTA